MRIARVLLYIYIYIYVCVCVCVCVCVQVFDEGYHIDPTTIVNVWLSNDESATIARAGFDVIHSYGWYLDQQIPGQPTNYFWLVCRRLLIISRSPLLVTAHPSTHVFER